MNATSFPDRFPSYCHRNRKTEKRSTRDEVDMNAADNEKKKHLEFFKTKRKKQQH